MSVATICGEMSNLYNSDNWEPELMTVFVTWKLRVTLDRICNSCNVLFLHHSLWCSSKLYAGHSKFCKYLHDKSSWMWCMYKTFVWYLNLHKIPLYSNCNFVWGILCLINHLDCVIIFWLLVFFNICISALICSGANYSVSSFDPRPRRETAQLIPNWGERLFTFPAHPCFLFFWTSNLFNFFF